MVNRANGTRANGHRVNGNRANVVDQRFPTLNFVGSNNLSLKY